MFIAIMHTSSAGIFPNASRKKTNKNEEKIGFPKPDRISSSIGEIHS
jgi:hypothetical protein